MGLAEQACPKICVVCGLPAMSYLHDFDDVIAMTYGEERRDPTSQKFSICSDWLPSGQQRRSDTSCSSKIARLGLEWEMAKRPVIVDIDGTCFDIDGRDPYSDNPRCVFWDRPNDTVRRLVQGLDIKHAIVFFSARREVLREVTEEALVRENFHRKDSKPRLLMRANGDLRGDVAVKREMLAWLRAGGVEPVMAIDDRPRVIREVWKAAGISVVQVGRSVGETEGDHDF